MCAGRAVAAVIAAALAAGCLVGCERRSATPAAPGPSTQAAATQAATQAATRPATAAAAQKPAVSSIMIDGQAHQFPRARLRIKQDESGLRATLHSDDPKEAIRDDYTGNSYYLEMPLEIDDVKNLATTSWRFSSPTIERAESASNGIFLEGARKRLQPKDVTVDFDEQTDGKLIVSLTGQFVLFDKVDDDAAAPLVRVEGRFVTEPERK